MKTTQITFINSIPEVTGNEKSIKIDFGVLTLELTQIEVESLLMNIMGAYRGNPIIVEFFKQRR